MISTRRLAATWHGIMPAEVFDRGTRSVVVANVQAGSPAEAAGLQPGDRLVQVGSLNVASPLDVERGMLELRPGQQTQVVVNRAGEQLKLPLTIQGLVATTAAVVPAAPTGDVDDRIWRSLGVRTIPVTSEYVSAVSAKFRGGLYVKDVQPGGPADRAFIRQGDILVGMNVGERDWETIRPDNLIYILSRPEVARTQTLQYYLVRRNGFIQGLLSLAEAPAATARR
jgi:serine protease Do